MGESVRIPLEEVQIANAEVEIIADMPIPEVAPELAGDFALRRLRAETTWKQKQRKAARNSWQGYTNASGKEIPANTLQPPCAGECSRKCGRLLSPQQRQVVHERFWKLGSPAKQWEYIVFHTKRNPVVKRRNPGQNSRRDMTLKYYLPGSDGESVQVCKRMFLSTLSINDR